MIEIDWGKKKEIDLDFDIKFVRFYFVSKENILFQSFLIIYSVKFIKVELQWRGMKRKEEIVKSLRNWISYHVYP